MALKVGIELKDSNPMWTWICARLWVARTAPTTIICDNSIKSNEGAIITMPTITKSKSLPNEPQVS